MINTLNQTVKVNGTEVRLTAREFQLVEFLSLKGGIVSREAILDYLYDGDTPDAKILDVFISKIRRRVRLASGGTLIETVWGRGYRL